MHLSLTWLILWHRRRNPSVPSGFSRLGFRDGVGDAMSNRFGSCLVVLVVLGKLLLDEWAERRERLVLLRLGAPFTKRRFELARGLEIG
jgi:hypothetical protein